MRNAEEFSQFINKLLVTKSMYVQDHLITSARETPGNGLTREEHWLLHAIYTSRLLDERRWHCNKFLGKEKEAAEIEAFAKTQGHTFDSKPYRTQGNLLYDVYREMSTTPKVTWDLLPTEGKNKWENTAAAYTTLERLWGC